MVYGMQIAILGYYIRKLQILARNNTYMNDETSKAITSTILNLPTIISKIYDYYIKTQPLMITV